MADRHSGVIATSETRGKRSASMKRAWDGKDRYKDGTRDLQARFLATLPEHRCVVASAARAVGTYGQIVTGWRRMHPDFKEAMDLIRREYRDSRASCSIGSCSKSRYGHQPWCQAHYMRLRTLGDVFAEIPLKLRRDKDTILETLLARAFRGIGLRYEPQAKILRRYAADFFFPPDLVVEADGDYWHQRADVAARDRRRDVAMRAAGYRVVRFWGNEIQTDAPGCAAKVALLLAQ